MVRFPTSRALLALAAFMLPIGASAALPPSLAKTAASSLRPGQFLWDDTNSGNGPVAIMVSIDRQHLYVYRDSALIGVSTVSTGKPGKDTPMGEFRILQKNLFHRSNLYSNAPMPYMQRLTWGGIAIHAGHLPGYPASHGCIRVPLEFAKKLFAATDMGGVVSVSDGQSGPFLRIEVDVAGLSGDAVPAWNGKTQAVRLANREASQPVAAPPIAIAAPRKTMLAAQAVAPPVFVKPVLPVSSKAERTLPLDRVVLVQSDAVAARPQPVPARDPAQPHWLVPYYTDDTGDGAGH